MRDIQTADIVRLGRHRLTCGDAFSAADVDLLMDGAKADMLYCDPPYGMGLKPNYAGAKRSQIRRIGGGVKGVRSLEWAPVIGDQGPFNPGPVISRFDGCQEQFWWGADYYRASLPDGGSWLVWDKRVHERCDKMDGTKFELCWSRTKHQRDIARVLWSGVLGMNGVDAGHRLHPTQKPIKLALWFLERYSKTDANIVDLFAGSGSTLLACERTGRTCYSAEISPDYCDVIVERWEALTGCQAEYLTRAGVAA